MYGLLKNSCEFKPDAHDLVKRQSGFLMITKTNKTILEEVTDGSKK